MSWTARGPKILRSRISTSNNTIPWTTRIGTCCMLLSTAAPIAQSLASIPTPRGKAFCDSLPPLKPFHRRVYLLRHGQTDWNKEGLMQGGGYDIPLNSNGQTQAEAVASELSGIPLSVVASSHLQRALQTANHVGESHGSCERLVDARFGEMRFGDFEGTCIHGPNANPQNQARFQEMQHAMKSDVHLKWPGKDAESTMAVATRGEAAIQALLDQQDDSDHVAVVAHGRFNKILLATLLWKDASRYVEIEQGNTSINVMDYNESTGDWKAILLNYSEHAPDANAKQELKRLQQEALQQKQQPTMLEQFNATAGSTA